MEAASLGASQTIAFQSQQDAAAGLGGARCVKEVTRQGFGRRPAAILRWYHSGS